MVRVHHGPLSSNAELVYEDLIARGKQVETAKRWRATVQRFEACCGVKDNYSRSDVIKFLAQLRSEGIKQNTINSRLRSIKLLCVVQKWSDGWPELSMPKVKKSDISRPALSVEDIGRIITVARSMRDGKPVCNKKELAFLAAATTYGLRREEIGTLEVFDGSVKVHTAKGGEVITQLIPDILKEYLAEYRGSNDVRFLTRVFQSIIEKVGLELENGFGWHSIRRALASELVMRDVSAMNILRFMRWSDTSLKSEFGMLVIYAKREQDKIDKSIFEVHPFLSAWSANV